MTGPADAVGTFREPLTAGVEIECEPLADGLRLAAYYQDEPVHSGEYNLKILGSDTLKGQFKNRLIDGLEKKSGVDTDAVRAELNEWFAKMYELYQDERKQFHPEHIQQIIEGTESVEVYGGETTTWHVTLTYAGRTRELQFTSSEMVAGNGGVLEEKIANEYFELVDIEAEAWETIREHWQEQKEVVTVVDETARDTVADRVLEYLQHNVMPVDDREKLANGPSSAWYDPNNITGDDVAPADAPILWVQDSFLVDQLEEAGRNLEYKSKLIKTLSQRGDIYGTKSDGRKRWPNPQGNDRVKFYAFDPDALGVSGDDVGGGGDPNHSEVEA